MTEPRQSGHHRRIWQIAAVLGILAWPAAGQDAASQIKAEAQRLERSLKAKPITDPDFPNANSMIEGDLKAVAEALSAGSLYLSLERLGRASDFLQGARTAAGEKAEVVKGGLPAFESRWEKASLKLAALDRQAREQDWSNVRAAIRALSETAQVKARPLLEGGQGFATSTQPKDGLFYLGQAQGEAGFARFCAALKLPLEAPAFPARSMLPELRNLQDKTNAAFQPPRSINLHARFIALNSTLKLAHELDAAKFYAGALYQYLEAVRHYGMLDAAPVDAAGQLQLKSALAAANRKVESSGRDDSMARLFLERAASQMAHADGSAPSVDEWSSARVILDRVLPAYYAALEAPSPLRPASGKTVDITLVRWPYT